MPKIKFVCVRIDPCFSHMVAVLYVARVLPRACRGPIAFKMEGNKWIGKFSRGRKGRGLGPRNDVLTTYMVW